MSNANPKGEHYAAQLEAALVQGQWTSNAPAKGYNQVPISWSELFRKHRKHCPADAVAAEVASQLHAVSLLLLRGRSLAEDPEGDDRSVDGELRFTDECVLSAECKAEGQESYDKLDAIGDKTDSVRSTLGYMSYTLARPHDCLVHLKSFSADDVDSLSPWARVERIRSLTLKGMASELVSPADALGYYTSVIQLLPPPAPANPPGELARWAERALWRACILSAQSLPASEVLPVMRTYVAHTSRWPAAFRPRHRSTVLRLHLHALSLCAPPGPSSQRPGRLAWLHETRTTVAEARAVLTGSTRFPASGARNVAVEAFVDGCVRVWEAGGATGEQADWLIDIIYWAMRLTFNSPRLMRHLSRLLAASGDIQLSKRTLMLYIRLMQHAREASDKSAPRSPVVDGLPNGASVYPPPPDDGSDPDPLFLHTIVHGIRMLCRAGDAPAAAELVPIARGVLERCRLPQYELDEAKAALDLAQAIWNLITGVKAHSPDARQKHLQAARSLLEDIDTPAASYHLALVLSLGGSATLNEAIATARAAVEGAPREVRAWHLLGLLLSAQGDVSAARSILELGGALEEEDPAPPDPTTIDILKGWNEQQFGWPGEQEDWGKRDEREDALQLRMTLVALMENVLGAEGASKRWVEVFTWWSQMSPENTSSHNVTPEIPALTLTRTMTPPVEQDEHSPDTPIPIQLIPPSPAETETPSSHSQDASPRISSPTSEKEKDGDKLMAKMREQVTKGRARIDTISKKIATRGRSNSDVRRSSSAPDFSLVLSRTSSYQASSIHSRGRLPSPIGSLAIRRRSPSPPPPPPPPPPSAEKEKAKGREKRDRRLRSELWLMSAATFRRQGRLESARGAIQYAEACDPHNANVYTQLGLYYVAHRDAMRAAAALDKALVLSPDNVQAHIHRATLHLDADDVDLAEGILNGLTTGAGWATPEAWFVRAQAAGRQGRVKEQRQWLERALVLCEGRGIREVGEALGWCL
ncbi:TPR-like protein [Exidia glandulosa HHB12029]|uniref:TPR-like protein n=1 Tax=Exidia glandulosa HHB12029 TaxID=1314781 RepID=A0A165M8Y0_EXIGL|nr:TPR-like protein [Exidia glandulosa HHB12029]